MANSEKTSPKPKLEDSIAKLKELQLGFKQTLLRLHEMLTIIGDDPDLQDDMDSLKRDVETKAQGLEEEVKRLREDVKSIKELLDSDKKNNSRSNS
jgi:uncharacterized protein involved in exopolysaccharide biosynthesis